MSNPAQLVRVLVCFAGWMLLSFPVLAQLDNPLGISPQTRLENCALDQWTGDNGLLSNNLTSVFQASNGFLWISTNNGLMRFDGARLDVYNQEVIPFLSTDAFYRIYEDRDSTLWFASRGSGIVKFKNGQFSQFLPNNRLIPKSIRTLLVEDPHTVWAGSDNRGLLYIKDTSVVRLTHPLLTDVIIMSLKKGRAGELYIGTNSRGLLKYDNGTVVQIPLANSTTWSVNAVEVTPSGKLYVGTTEGLFEFDNGSSKPVALLEKVQVNHIITDAYGSVWIATERGLARINEREGVQEFLRSGKRFDGAHITSLCIDREGSLWMSTGKSGLLRMKEAMIRNYSDINGLSVDRVNVVTEASDGKFFVCLDEGHVNMVEGSTITSLTIDLPEWNESVRDLDVQKDGTLWLASYRGLLRKRGNDEKLFTTRDGLTSNSIRRIFRDSKDRMWLASRTGGVILFTGSSVEKVFNRSTGFSSDYILAIEEDKEGRIIIGTHSGGLGVINPDLSFEIFHVQKDDDGVLVFNVHVDDQNDLWLATSVGLYHFSFKTRRFTRITISEVVKGESYFDWLEDGRGSVWIPTNIGIIQLLKKDVRDFVDGKIAAVRSRLYNNHDGMRNKECTGATRSTLASNGEVWVPTIDGICVISPELKKTNMVVPPVYITEIATDEGTRLYPGDTLSVEPGNVRVTIRFTALSLLAPQKVKFKYRLATLDAEWKDAAPGSRSVDYTSLRPGNYVFSVIASNNDGIWNEAGASILLEVQPFFYQTAWFYLLLIALFLVLAYSIYRWRVNAVEKKNLELLKVNSELDRFVYSASHDLRAPLASILGLVKLTKIDPDPKHRSEYLDKVEKSIHKLDGFIHDIINYSRNARTEITPSQIDFDPFIRDILEGLQYQENVGRIRKEVVVKGEGVFRTDAKRLNIVLYNLISNAIKYHNLNQPEPFIEISVEYSDEEAVIKISDNGIGIDQKHVENIFKMFYRADERSSGSGLGLFIAKEAISKINGRLTVSSQVGKGSAFTVHLPSLKGK